jgi:hypothetical protein
MVEKKVQVFSNHAEAAAADRAYYRALSPEQRLDLLLDIVRQHRESEDEAAARFERVYRVVELSRS